MLEKSQKKFRKNSKAQRKFRTILQLEKKIIKNSEKILELGKEKRKDS